MYVCYVYTYPSHRVYTMNPNMEAIMKEFTELKHSLKQAGIQALQEEHYEESRRITGIVEELSRLETRAGDLLGRKAGATESSGPLLEQEGSFPKFYRIGNVLYKEALKSNGRSTYVHKVSKQDAEQIMGVVSHLGAKGAFRAEDVQKKLDCPAYYVYVMLKLLQKLALVRSPKRGQYLLKARDSQIDADSVWGQIPEQSAH